MVPPPPSRVACPLALELPPPPPRLALPNKSKYHSWKNRVALPPFPPLLTHSTSCTLGLFGLLCSHSGHPAQTAIGSQAPSYTLVLETFVPICTVQEVATAAIHNMATLLPCLCLQKTNPTKSMQPCVRNRLFG